MTLQSFVERNRTALVAAVLAVGAVGSAVYYLSQQPGSFPDSASEAGGATTKPESHGNNASAASKKKKSKKKAARKDTLPPSHGFRAARDAPNGPVYPVIEDAALAARGFTDKERKEIAAELKNAGNFAFNARDLEHALHLYTQAIEMSEEAVYYSNRSAVYGLMEDFQNVIEDTTRALRLHPDYVKCYSRRGVAYEKLGNYAEAAVDMTAACILSNFEDVNLGKSVDRTLKLQAERRAAERYPEEGEAKAGSSPEFPSPAFIAAYFRAFHKRPLPPQVEEATEEGKDGCYALKQALDAVDKENLESYKQAYSLLNEAVAAGLPTKAIEALAYEYLATFKFLLNDIHGALADIDRSIATAPTAQAMIKRSSLYIELGQLDKANDDFSQAEQIDPNSADYHYQLAQLAFLQKNWDVALQGYERSLEIDDSFVLAHIQKAVTKYRQGSTDEARELFKGLLERFPSESTVHNYYGEILLDSHDEQGAMAEFDKAIELEKAKGTAAIDVLPMLNKALAIVQLSMTQTNVENAMVLCRKALAIDPASEVAVGTLAQFCMQQGDVKEAVELYEKNADLARTHQERIQALTFAEGARTQMRIHSNPILRSRLEQLSRQRGF